MTGLKSGVRTAPTARQDLKGVACAVQVCVDVPRLTSREAIDAEHLAKPLVLHAEGARLTVQLGRRFVACLPPHPTAMASVVLPTDVHLVGTAGPAVARVIGVYEFCAGAVFAITPMQILLLLTTWCILMSQNTTPSLMPGVASAKWCPPPAALATRLLPSPLATTPSPRCMKP
jgi:hypothetical protein